MPTELDDVKHQVAVANRILSEMGLTTGVTASLGHASMRLPSDSGRFAVKGRGYAIDVLSRVLPHEMVVCDLNGSQVEGPAGLTPCYEIKMHSCIYRARPEVQSVVHVHPRYTVVMSVLQKTLVPMCPEGIDLVRHTLPVYPHNKLILTDEDGTEVAETLGDAPAVLLLGHGAATVGKDLIQSVMNMFQLEEQARMNWYAHCAAGPNHAQIPENLIAESDNRPPIHELPHLAELFGGSPAPVNNGVWLDYVDRVSKDL